MSSQNPDKEEGGNAPPYSWYDNSMRAPPPTYEESQRSGGAYNLQHTPASHPSTSSTTNPNQYYGMIYHNQQVPLHVQMQPSYYGPPPGMHHGTGYGLAGPSTSAGAAASHVLEVDSRAQINSTSSFVVPPPPPGCLPTPAQLAAMQGQPVVVKQKKRSFF